MSKMNILIHLNAYSDEKDTNNPDMSNVRWNRDIQGIAISEPISKAVRIASGQSLSLFSGTVSVDSDATTTWDIALKSGSSSTYVLTHAGGTAPNFRTARTEGHDATTEITITKNAKLLTFTATGGTIWDLVAGGVVVGDDVIVGNLFNASNVGTFKVIAVSTTSFTVENELGVAEGPITLGAAFAEQINIFSNDGVQIEDKIDILAGFSPVTFGAYEITAVSHNYIEFFSSQSLPTESSVSNNPDAFLIYRDAKSILYIESDKKLNIKINGSAVTNQIEPLTIGTSKKPGIFMSVASLKSAEVINTSLETANVFYIASE
jgi:hypothetical protein